MNVAPTAGNTGFRRGDIHGARERQRLADCNDLRLLPLLRHLAQRREMEFVVPRAIFLDDRPHAPVLGAILI